MNHAPTLSEVAAEAGELLQRARGVQPKSPEPLQALASLRCVISLCPATDVCVDPIEWVQLTKLYSCWRGWRALLHSQTVHNCSYIVDCSC